MKKKFLSFLLVLSLLIPGVISAGPPIIYGTSLGSAGTGFDVGTVGAPSIFFTGDTNTGWYWIGADNIGLSLGGVKVWDITKPTSTFYQSKTSDGSASGLSVYSHSTAATGNNDTLTSFTAQGEYSFIGAVLRDYIGYHVDNFVLSAGTLTNQYGIYIDNLTSATNNYAIYTAGGKISYTLGASDGVVIDRGVTASGTNALAISHTTATTNSDAFSINDTITATTGIDVYGADILAYWNKVVTGTAGSMSGLLINATKAGADTSVAQLQIFGAYIQAQQTGSTDAGTRDTYGGYFMASGDTAGTSTTYGLYASASGADTNYSLKTGGGSVYHRLGALESMLVDGNTTKNTLGTGKFYVVSDTLTADTRAATVSYNDYRTTGNGYVSALGLFIGDSAVKTANDAEFYGLTSATTVNAAHSSAGTLTAYGADITSSQTGSTDAGTRVTYGVKATATGDANGTSTAYGVHATATGADTNYAGYFVGDIVVTGTVSQNGLKYWSSATAEADEGSVTLPAITANYSGHGFVRVSAAGVIADSAEFESGSDGNVSLIRATANVVVGAACANAKICISTAAAQNPIVVQARNGAGQVEIEFWYK